MLAWFGIGSLLMLCLLLLLKKSCKKSLYCKKNIFLVGAAVGLFPLLIILLFESIAQRSGALTVMRLYPSFFAWISLLFFSILAVFMIVSNVELVRREGAAPGNILGSLLALFIVGVSFAVYYLTDYRSDSFLLRAVSCFLFAMLDYFDCFLIGIIIMGWICAGAKPAYDKDYIIILGCSISKTGGLLPLLKARTNRAIRYAWEQEIAAGIPVRYVPSGGQGADEIMSEGSAMELYLLSHGAEPEEVFPEKKSVNTLENFRLSKKIIDELKPDAKIAFSTTNYHVLRSGMLARMLDIEAEGIGSKTKWYFWPNGFAREVIAICELTKLHHLILILLLAGLSVLTALLT